MNRLRKFVEGAVGERRGRVAYVFGTAAALPEPVRGLDWRPVSDFNAAEAIMEDEGLREVFKAALKHGVAIVAPAGPGND